MLTGTLTEKIYNFSGVLNANLKSDSHLPKKRVICLIENPLKTMKNAFYFILKAPLRYLSFCRDFLVM